MGNLLQRKTVGIIGAGRIGFAYAKMMVEGLKMNIIYYDMYQNKNLESYFGNYSKFLEANGNGSLHMLDVVRVVVLSLPPLLQVRRQLL